MLNHDKLFFLDPQVTAELKEKDDLTILDLLPTEDSVAQIITKYLVQMQNEFIEKTNPTADRYTVTSALELRHCVCNRNGVRSRR